VDDSGPGPRGSFLRCARPFVGGLRVFASVVLAVEVGVSPGTSAPTDGSDWLRFASVSSTGETARSSGRVPIGAELDVGEIPGLGAIGGGGAIPGSGEGAWGGTIGGIGMGSKEGGGGGAARGGGGGGAGFAGMTAGGAGFRAPNSFGTGPNSPGFQRCGERSRSRS
jgi:hypothetical protein